MEKETEAREKIGLFGGTFNPIHMGHVRSAEEICERFGLSKIFFIPAYMPPHKAAPIIAASKRLEMVRLALAGNPLFDVSEHELTRKGSSYSYETIDYFNKLYVQRAELFFIMGMDAFGEIHTWKNYPAFFSLCNFIVMSRPGHTGDTRKRRLPPGIRDEFTCISRERCYEHLSGRRLFFCRVALLEISSTDIRSRAARGGSIKYLVADAVERYIHHNSLYIQKRDSYVEQAE